MVGVSWVRTGRRLPRWRNGQPFTWTKTADEILNSLAKYMAKISGAGHYAAGPSLCDNNSRSITTSAAPPSSASPSHTS